MIFRENDFTKKIFILIFIGWSKLMMQMNFVEKNTQPVQVALEEPENNTQNNRNISIFFPPVKLK